MKLSFAFSPCPNDTFMFEAIVNRRIWLGDYELKVHLLDIEELNQAALAHKYDITKLSYNTFSMLTDSYQLLDAGSALGHNCGPLLISKNEYNPKEVNDLKIAIPGENTTAFLLLKYAFPDIKNWVPMLFSDIEAAIINREVDAGLIIHENRFTYQQKGLIKIIDLGEYWEKMTGSPIPLGGIVIKSELDQCIKMDINRILYESIKTAFEDRNQGMDYVRTHAQAMDDEVMRAHIALYVNDFSLSLGKEGKNAVEHLLNYKNGNSTTDFDNIYAPKSIDKIYK